MLVNSYFIYNVLTLVILHVFMISYKQRHAIIVYLMREYYCNQWRIKGGLEDYSTELKHRGDPFLIEKQKNEM